MKIRILEYRECLNVKLLHSSTAPVQDCKNTGNL